MTAKPATSCHLTYPLPEQINTASNWSLENTVSVEETTDCTYFCVVGWGPGGYSGIQQTANNGKVAIFSMWNNGTDSVELESAGPGANVTTFGGEGTGLKCMKDFKWEKDVPVTFRISGKKVGDYWICDCIYEYQGEQFFMASYKRKGKRPLNNGGFYSFVEDWDRCDGAEGHCIQRSAYFFNQSAVIDGKPVQLDSCARFSKVENGHDLFGSGKAMGLCCQQRFYLSTGGCEKPAVSNGTMLRK